MGRTRHRHGRPRFRSGPVRRRVARAFRTQDRSRQGDRDVPTAPQRHHVLGSDQRDGQETERIGGAQVSNELEHRGYKGSVEYNSEDRILFGKVLFIDSLLMYHGATVDEIEAAFRETVDSYLQHCEATGKQPNKPYSGSFNVRVGAERHRAAAQLAYRKGCSLNEVVCQALDGCLANE